MKKANKLFCISTGTTDKVVDEILNDDDKNHDPNINLDVLNPDLNNNVQLSKAEDIIRRILSSE